LVVTPVPFWLSVVGHRDHPPIIGRSGFHAIAPHRNGLFHDELELFTLGGRLEEDVQNQNYS
jgi:hypothetical protein